MAFYNPEDSAAIENKAGFNQARNISEILSNLLGGYVLHMNNREYSEAVKVIRRIHDIISPRVKSSEIEEVDKKVEKIEELLPKAMEKYTNRLNGFVYMKNPELNIKVEREIELLFRFVNKLQDKYGYGMISEDDEGL